MKKAKNIKHKQNTNLLFQMLTTDYYLGVWTDCMQHSFTLLYNITVGYITGSHHQAAVSVSAGGQLMCWQTWE